MAHWFLGFSVRLAFCPPPPIVSGYSLGILCTHSGLPKSLKAIDNILSSATFQGVMSLPQHNLIQIGSVAHPWT